MFGRPIARMDVIAWAALVITGVGIPLWLAAAAGAIGLPSNDDWVYMRASTSLFSTGQVNMPGHTAAFIGQLALVQPFLWLSRGEPWAFTLFGLVMTAIGITAAYLLSRRFLRTSGAVVVVLLVAVFPGFARESASFMTDVPAYALAILSLLLGTRWLHGAGGRATLVASIGVGLLAVSIREFALAAPVAVLATAWARNRSGDRVLLAGLSALLVAGVIGILSVASSTSGRGAAPSPDTARLIFIGPAFATLAAVLLPATLLCVGRQIGRFSAVQLVFAAGLVCLSVLHPEGPILGNLWTQYGVADNQVLQGVRSPVIGEMAWMLSRQITLFAAILGAAVAIRWSQRHLAGARSLREWASSIRRIARRRDGLLVLFLVAYAVELLAYAPLATEFDRYLYPMVPVAAILLLRGPRRPFQLRPRHALVHAAAAWLVVSAYVISANSFAYDGARYREGDAAVALGYRADTVDAGYEWVGAHSNGSVQVPDQHYGLRSYEDYLFATPPCAILSNSPLESDTYRLIRVNHAEYRQYLFFGPDEALYLYGALSGGCPPPPAAVSAEAPSGGVQVLRLP